METLYSAAVTTAKNVPITERIKTFEDACRELGLTDVKLGITGLDDDKDSIVAYTKLTIIARALNEGWKPDWSDSGQYKYVPWFEHKSGFGLSYGDCDSWYSFTLVGSRLCYKTGELAKYAATQFADLYKDFLSIK